VSEELRCYTFTNWMLRSIQQGIQSGHASMELVNKYMVEQGWQNGHAETLGDWIKNHKTIICLNGGNADGIREIKQFFDNECNPFPYAGFCEDQQSLDGSLTSVAVILPAKIFDTAQFLRMRELPPGVSYTFDRLLDEHRYAIDDDDGMRVHTFTPWEHELMVRLNRYRLAT
jgi:hypothetical protein